MVMYNGTNYWQGNNNTWHSGINDVGFGPSPTITDPSILSHLNGGQQPSSTMPVPQYSGTSPPPSPVSSPTTNSTSPAPFSWNISDLGALINNPSPATGGIDMTQASPGTALQNQFMQTPAYQLQYGNNTNMNPGQRFASDPGVQLQYGQINPNDDPFQRFTQDSGTKLRYGNIDPNASPDQRFLSDAGTQLSIQQGMQPLINSFASQGLAQSGALAKSLSDYSFNHYNDYMNQQQQSYNNYTAGLGGAYNTQMQNQGSLFSNYQNQLQGLTNLGAQNTGNQNALQNNQLLAQLLGQANLSTGNNLSNSYMNAGNNISSLFGNQGTNGMGAILGTGAAQNTNYANGLSQALQAYFAQQAGNASAAGGQGAMQGSGSGGFF